MKHIEKASLAELRARHDRGQTHPDRDGMAEALPEDFWADAEVIDRAPKKSVHLRVDADVLEFFRAGGKGHLTRMNSVLRSYVQAQKKRTG